MFCVFVAVLVVFLLPRASVVADASRISLFLAAVELLKFFDLFLPVPCGPSIWDGGH